MASPTDSSTSLNSPDEIDWSSSFSLSDCQSDSDHEARLRTEVDNQKSPEADASGPEQWTTVTRRHWRPEKAPTKHRALEGPHTEQTSTRNSAGRSAAQIDSTSGSVDVSEAESRAPLSGSVSTPFHKVQKSTGGPSGADIESCGEERDIRKALNPAEVERPYRVEILKKVSESARRRKNPAVGARLSTHINTQDQRTTGESQAVLSLPKEKGEQNTAEGLRSEQYTGSFLLQVQNRKVRNEVLSPSCDRVEPVEQLDSKTNGQEANSSTNATHKVRPAEPTARSNPIVRTARVSDRQASNKRNGSFLPKEDPKDDPKPDSNLELPTINSTSYPKSLSLVRRRYVYARMGSREKKSPCSPETQRLAQIKQISVSCKKQEEEEEYSEEHNALTLPEGFPMFGFSQDVCNRYARDAGSPKDTLNLFGPRVLPTKSNKTAKKSCSRFKDWPELWAGASCHVRAKLYIEVFDNITLQNQSSPKPVSKIRSGAIRLGQNNVATWTPIARKELLSSVLVDPSRPREFLSAPPSSTQSCTHQLSFSEFQSFCSNCQFFRPKSIHSKSWTPVDFISHFVDFYVLTRAPRSMHRGVSGSPSDWTEGVKDGYEKLQTQLEGWYSAMLRLPAFANSIAIEYDDENWSKRPAVAVFKGWMLMAFGNKFRTSAKASIIFSMKAVSGKDDDEAAGMHHPSTPTEVEALCHWATLGL